MSVQPSATKQILTENVDALNSQNSDSKANVDAHDISFNRKSDGNKRSCASTERENSGPKESSETQPEQETKEPGTDEC